MSQTPQHFDRIVKGTETEDALVILQYFKTVIGESFTLHNYYKEIPVTYGATLVNVEDDKAEFEVHESQAKAMVLERKTLISCPQDCPFSEDIVADVFNVNVANKAVALGKFGYAKSNAGMRSFVRVLVNNSKAIVHIRFENGVKITGTVKDISLGGAAVSITPHELLTVDVDVNAILKLPDQAPNKIIDISLRSKIVKIIKNESDEPVTCMLVFYPDTQSQQLISYYINQQQVVIIKELKNLILQ